MIKSKIKKILLLAFIIFLAIFIYKDTILQLFNIHKTNKNITVDISELENSDNPQKLLQVHFIDVGQGDATLVTIEGHAMLVDGGDYTKGTTVQKYLQTQGVDRLEYIVATHPDSDHIGGLDVIVYKFPCENIFMPEVSKDTKSYDDLIKAIEEKNYTKKAVYQGEEFYLGEVKCTVLNPVKGERYEDINDYSIALKLEYKDVSIILPGDIDQEGIDNVISGDMDIKCDIYKAAHHGSSKALDKELLREMSPDYAIISCGKDNDYGHPHHEVVDYFEKKHIEVCRTDLDGSVVVFTDGNKIAIQSDR